MGLLERADAFDAFGRVGIYSQNGDLAVILGVEYLERPQLGATVGSPGSGGIAYEWLITQKVGQGEFLAIHSGHAEVWGAISYSCSDLYL